MQMMLKNIGIIGTSILSRKMMWDYCSNTQNSVMMGEIEQIIKAHIVLKIETYCSAEQWINVKKKG